MVASHKAVAMDDKKKMGKVLPWVHITISNAKRNILDAYNKIKADFNMELTGWEDFCEVP